MKIVFIGTPKFGAIILEKLAATEYKPVLVITSPDKPIGRKQILAPSQVKQSAQEHNIPIVQPKEIKNLTPELKKLKPDIIIACAYGQIVPRDILEIPKYGCLNIHPSLLPKYRGSSPIQHAILNGDEETGITIIFMDEKMDHGKIISACRLPIPEEITLEKLSEKLARSGAGLLIKTIPEWVNNKIAAKSQDESKATYTKLLTKEDGKINWAKSAEEIERQIRAFAPWPGSWTSWEILKGAIFKIKILKAKVHKQKSSSVYPEKRQFRPGKVLVVPQNEIGISCGKGFLVIKQLQIEGKNPSFAEDFLRGYPDFIHATLL